MAKQKRIIDKRTGRPCDYEMIEAELARYRKQTGAEWRPAAEELAPEINEDQADSIVRNLSRRRRRRRENEAARGGDAAMPGLGVLYERIRPRLQDAVEAYERRPKVRADLEAAERELAVLHEAVRRREKALGALGSQEIGKKTPGLLDSLAAAESFAPATLYEAELAVVRQLEWDLNDIRLKIRRFLNPQR